MTTATEDEDIRPPEEWEATITHLKKRIMKVVTGYAATDAIAAMADVLRHIATIERD